jgi:hypothetical protein
MGSALAIAPGKAVTSCTLLARASRIELHRDKVVLPATLEFPDVARDLCQLDVPGRGAQEPPRAAPRMGQRVYAIGFERGFEMLITEGLFSRVRDAGSDAERIQTSVPTTGGLLGAGLFDEEARLLGLVTTAPRDSLGTVFAVPARWLTELADRGRAALAARPAAADAAPAGSLPMPGATWNYSYSFRGLGSARYNFVVRAVGVEGGTVHESVAIGVAPQTRLAVKADALGFRSLPLPRSQTLVEFAPYLHVLLARNESIRWGTIGGYPIGNAAMPFWTLTATNKGDESVVVPAGTLKATLVEVWGKRQAPPGFVAHMSYESTRFRYRAWYAPEVRRYVKLQHETWSLNGQWSGEQVIELLSYTDK